jgi:Zn-dependent M16 (insulinase) family peptidase
MYDLESVSQIAKHVIRTFRHGKTGFRVTLAHIKGPLCSASFVVPTASKDHRGLPHTLEVFLLSYDKAFDFYGL